jgi:hypothetical protein
MGWFEFGFAEAAELPKHGKVCCRTSPLLAGCLSSKDNSPPLLRGMAGG